MKIRIKNLKLRIKKSLAILLIALTLVSALKFLIFKPKLALADSTLGFNEGYGTTVNDLNSTLTGTITNAVWKSEEFCKVSKCLYFDGSGDLINFGNDSDVTFTTGSFTITGWFRTPDITSGQRTIVAKHNATAGGYKVYIDSSGYLIFGIDPDSTWSPSDSVSSSTTALDDNKWHHFVAVKNGTTSISLYVDGNLMQTDSSITASSLTNSDTFYIGIDGNGSSNGFSGFLDEIKLYAGTARTQAEINADYLGETASRGVTASFGPDQSYLSNGLLGYWKMDETSGNAADASGNGLTLTNNATTTFVGGKFGNGSEHVPASSQYFSMTTTISGIKSVSFWTNPDATTNYFASLTSGAYITASSGTISATGFTDPKIFVNGIETTTIIADVWQLVTVTTEIAIDANQFYIGRQGSNYYDGTLDEVRTYNRALSPAEVAKLYNWTPGPVGYWDFNENNGTTTAFDKSVNANDLTMGSEGSPTTRVSDTFTETSDTEITSHTPNTGTGWSGIQNNLTCTQPSGAATSPVIQASTDTAKICLGSTITDAGQWASAQPDPTSVTQTITVTFASIYSGSGTRTVGIFGRRTDNDNAYVVYIYPNGHANDSVNLYKIVSGTATSLGSYDATLAIGTIIKLEITDSAKKVYVDGTERISSADNSLTSIGTWGLGFGRWQGTSATILAGNATFDWRLDDFLTEDTPSASPPTWIPGKFGSGLTFNGSNQQITRVDDTDFDFADDESITITTWFKHTTASAQEIILSKFNEAGYKIIMESDGDITCGLDYDSTWSPTDFATSTLATYDDGNWHHIACVKDGATSLSLYIDGVLITTDSSLTATNTLTNTDPIYIGIDADGTSNDFTGSLDDIKIYNYARNSAQVIEDMNAGHPAPGSPVGSSVAYWKFDEGYGTSAYDNSINANNLTLSTASWTNSGKFGKAFNGLTNVRASRTTDPDLEFSATDDFTLSLWYKSDSANNPAATEYLMASGGPAGSAGYAIYANTDGTICFGIDDDTSWGPDIASCTPTDVYDNTWHHVTAVRNAALDKTYIYLDAVEKDSDTDTTTATLDSSPTFYIGDANATDGTDEFLGDIDEVKIFRSALTPDAIKVLYNQSSGTNMGALSTDSSGVTSWSANDEYCPPGQETTCVPPVGHWKLDENTGTTEVKDSSTNNITENMNGSMTAANWIPGKLGSALDFDGVDDYLGKGPAGETDTQLQIIGDLTVGFWVNADTFTADEVLLSQGESGSDTEPDNRLYELTWKTSSGNDIYYGHENGAGTDNEVTFDANLTAGIWYYVSIVRDVTANTVNLYINGVKTGATFNYTNDPTGGSTSELGIGADDDGLNNLDGKIDDVRIYNYARTPAQVAWDYNRGGPVGWWKMDENTGTAANDTVGNSTAGTLTNSPTWITGKLNTGVTFAGSNQQILIADDPDFDFADDEDMSLTTWFKHSTASAQEIILSKYAAAGYKIIMEADGDITCAMDYDSTWSPTDSATSTAATYDDGNWHHIACVKTGATSLSLYIDGVLITTDSSITAANILTNADPLYLGIDADGTSLDFTGSLDDVRIYRYPLTTQQIKTIMNNGSAVKF